MFEIEESGNAQYLVYRLSEDEKVDSFAYEMIANNEIAGILKPIKTSFDGAVTFKYKLTSLLSFTDLLSSEVSKGQILSIYESIVNAMSEADDYLLLESSFVFHPDYTFVNGEKTAAALVYLPVEGAQVPNDVKNFLRGATSRIQDPNEYAYVGSLLSLFNSKTFDLDDLCRQIVSLKSAPAQGQVAQQARPAQQVVQQAAQQQRVQPVQQRVQPVQQAQPQPVQQVQQQPVQPVQQQPVQQRVQPVQQQPMQQQPVQPVQQRVQQQPMQPVQPQNNVVAPGGMAIPGGNANAGQTGGFSIPGGGNSQQASDTDSKGGLLGGLFGGKKDKSQKEKADKKDKKKESKGFSIPFGAKSDAQAQPAVGAGGFAIPGQKQELVFDNADSSWTPNYSASMANAVDGDFGDTFVAGAGQSVDAAEDETMVSQGYAREAFLTREINGVRVPLPNALVVGRSKQQAGYCIEGNGEISKRHANFTRSGSDYYVEDLGSLNHTYLNGRELVPGAKELLRDGDVISLSKERFIFNIR